MALQLYGTALAPGAVVASLPFAPEIVPPTLDDFIYQVGLKNEDYGGYKATFNKTHPDRSNNRFGWVTPIPPPGHCQDLRPDGGGSGATC